MKIPRHVYLLNRTLFRASAALFCLFFIIEAIVPGFVTAWINPVAVLIVAGLSGIIHILLHKDHD